MEQTIPRGLCQCGCGRRTTIAKENVRTRGIVKGQPMRYVSGHGPKRCLPVEPRFWAQVDRSSECWLWTGHVNTYGYGNLRVAGNWVLTHRLSYEWVHGPIPAGMHVCHRCDTPRCVNPDHLFLGTPSDNIDDMVRKGRQNYGERHPQAKLIPEEVLAIRAAGHGRREREVLAARFGVTWQHVANVQLGKCWRHLGDTA